MNAILGVTAFPENAFLAFNQSPILQVFRIGYMLEIGVSLYPGNEFPRNSFVAFMAVDVEQNKYKNEVCRF